MITLTGNYRFTSLNALAPGTFPVNETDTVTIRVDGSKRFVTVLGAGVRTLVSPRWGVRLDIRAYLSPPVGLLVDANPQVPTQTPAGAIASLTTPSMQFSDNASTGLRSSLSGPAIDGFQTFSGDGTEVRVSVTASYFVRF